MVPRQSRDFLIQIEKGKLPYFHNYAYFHNTSRQTARNEELLKCCAPPLRQRPVALAPNLHTNAPAWSTTYLGHNKVQGSLIQKVDGALTEGTVSFQPHHCTHLQTRVALTSLR